MSLKSIPGNGPIYEVIIPFQRSDEMHINPAAAKVFHDRMTARGPIYGELNHPDLSQIHDMQQRFARIHEVDINRSAIINLAAKLTDDSIIIRTQAIGNNAKDLDSGEYALSARGFGTATDANSSRSMDVLVTFDLLPKDKVKNPSPFVKISER